MVACSLWLALLLGAVSPAVKSRSQPDADYRAVADFHTVIASHAKARAEVAMRLRYDPDLLCASAKVHGFMNKQALERPAYHLSPESLAAYRTALVPVRQLNVIWVSDRHKFIYLRSHKAASATITISLVRHFCGRKAQLKDCDPAVLYMRRGALADPDKWRKYFVFTFVRNPWLRMASAFAYFQDLLRGVNPRTGRVDAHTPCAAAHSFADFTADSEAFVRQLQASRCVVWSHLCKGCNGPVPTHYIDTHFQEQSFAVFTSEGRSMVDYIGRVEHFGKDWNEVWRAMAKTRGPGFKKPETLAVNSAKSAVLVRPGFKNTCGVNKYEAMYNKTTFFNIALQYAWDMRTFGFL